MNPQVYFETNKINKKDSSAIKKQNSQLNKNLYNKDPKSLTIEDIKETYYIVPKVKDLVNLNKNVNLTVYDIPGLNDCQTKNLYFQYLNDNFYKFDVILFIVDIHSALNTSDESDILEKILQNSKENFEKYGIQKKLIVVANKCDELIFNGDQFEFQDEELGEMFNQIETIVKQRVDNIYPDMQYSIVPLSSEDSYIYRMYDENPTYELDLKHINKFGCNEYGRSRWNRLSNVQKKNKIQELMIKMNIKETLKHTGFLRFSKILNKYLNYENQYIFLLNHLRYGLQKIDKYNKLDIREDMQQFYLFFKRFQEINSSFISYIGLEKCKNDVFHKYLDDFLKNYGSHIIFQYIDVPNTSIKTDAHLPQVEQIKSQFDEFSAKFNTESKMVEEIKTLVTESLNIFYVHHIKNRKMSVKSLMEYIYKLFRKKFKITNDLVLDIFSNEDMKNTSSEEVIKHINSLEKKKLVNLKQKKIIILDFLKTIYNSTFQGNHIQNIPMEKRASYFYYGDIFWTKIMFKKKYKGYTF